MDGRLKPTGRHPTYMLERRDRMKPDWRYLQQMVEESAVKGPPAHIVHMQEKLFTDPKEAAAALGMDQISTMIAERMITDIVKDARSAYGIAKQGRALGWHQELMKTIIRRGMACKYKQEERMEKAMGAAAPASSAGSGKVSGPGGGRAFPDGTHRVHGGVKVVKQGGVWVPEKTAKKRTAESDHADNEAREKRNAESKKKLSDQSDRWKKEDEEGNARSEANKQARADSDKKMEAKRADTKKKVDEIKARTAAKAGGGGKTKEIDKDVKARFAGLHAKARQHGVKINGSLKDHHGHEHMDKLEAKLNDHLDSKRSSMAAKRPAPKTDQAKQGMASEIDDTMTKLQSMEHRIDSDHKPLYDRLKKEASAVSKNPSGSAIDWFQERAKSFMHLVTGKKAGAGGSDHGAVPASDPESDKIKEGEGQEQAKKFKTFAKGASKKLRGLVETGAHRIMHAVKHTAEEFPVAAKAIGKIADGNHISKKETHALISVGVTIGSVALAGMTVGAGGAAVAGAHKVLTHAATAAVSKYLTTAFVGYAGIELGEQAMSLLELMKSEEYDLIKAADKKKAKKKADPEAKGIDESDPDDGKDPMFGFTMGVMEHMADILDHDFTPEELASLTSEEDEKKEKKDSKIKKSLYFTAEGDLIEVEEYEEEPLIKAMEIVVEDEGYLPQKIEDLPPPEPVEPVDHLALYNRLQPLAKAKGLYTQMVEGQISILGDLQKSGVAEELLDHPGSMMLSITDTTAVDDLIKALE